MFSRIRKRFTYANVAMTLALVFAMTGGAYAASKYVISSTKQIKPSVISQLKGKNGANGKNGATGATGATGAPGATGAQGPAGTNGTNGSNGNNGVNGITGPKGATGPAGITGPKGATGPEGVCSTSNCVLPSGVSLKGEWDAERTVSGVLNSLADAVSFVVPLSAAPGTVHYIKAPTEEEKEHGEFPATPAGCTGNVENPGAEDGNLCVFAEEESNVAQASFAPKVEYVKSIGFRIKAVSEEAGQSRFYGTWAVTAP